MIGRWGRWLQLNLVCWVLATLWIQGAISDELAARFGPVVFAVWGLSVVVLLIGPDELERELSSREFEEAKREWTS